MDKTRNLEFLKAINEKQFIEQRFDIYKKTLLKMLNEEIPKECRSAILASIPDVIRRCDEIEYNATQVVAYIIMHFLDRYYRFCLIYCDLLKRGMFPDKLQMRMMDIGAGPGPSMYAYSDIMCQINIYRKSCGLPKLNFTIDYAEQSEGFRQFLHHFTERLLLEGQTSYVPFHHGTYKDAQEFDLREKKTSYDYFAMWNNRRKNYIISKYFHEYYMPRSFNIVVYSNFLTNIDTVNTFAEQIRKVVFWLRNGGLLVVVGGNPDDPKYHEVYERIDEIIGGQRYSNKNFAGYCKKVVSSERMCYMPNCSVATQMGDFHRQIFQSWTDGKLSFLEKKTRMMIKNEINGVGNPTDWWLTVYRRYSKFRGEIQRSHQ